MTAQGILSILGTGPNYGYQIKRQYDNFFRSQKELSYGQVYATLARLLRDGKVKTVEDRKSGGPERTRYFITPKGQQELQEWLNKPETQTAQIQATLFCKVVSAILLNKDPHVYLDVQKASHLERMRTLTRVRRSADMATALQADLELFHLEADLRWMDLTEARLQTLTQEVRP